MNTQRDLYRLGLRFESKCLDSGELASVGIRHVRKGRPSRWVVTLHAPNGESAAFEFEKGPAHRIYMNRHGEWVPVPGLFMGSEDDWARVVSTSAPVHPDLEEVLECLAADAIAEEFTFSQWCDECGLSDDSIRASRIYELCLRSAADLRRLGLDRRELAEFFGLEEEV